MQTNSGTQPGRPQATARVCQEIQKAINQGMQLGKVRSDTTINNEYAIVRPTRCADRRNETQVPSFVKDCNPPLVISCESGIA